MLALILILIAIHIHVHCCAGINNYHTDQKICILKLGIYLHFCISTFFSSFFNGNIPFYVENIYLHRGTNIYNYNTPNCSNIRQIDPDYLINNTTEIIVNKIYTLSRLLSFFFIFYGSYRNTCNHRLGYVDVSIYYSFKHIIYFFQIYS